MGEDSKNIVITSAVRTPIGTFRGSLKDLEAKDLGALVTKESLKRSNLNPNASERIVVNSPFFQSFVDIFFSPFCRCSK